jgi:hypothetical protein
MRLNVHLNSDSNTLNRLNFTDRLQTIETLDLEPIKYKLVREKGWTLENADRTETLYKAFLQLHLLYPRGMHVPTEDIDEMWHAHILDTGKYMVDCFTIFGHYLHHFPYLGMKDAADAERLKTLFAETKQRMLDTGMIDPNSPDGIVFADCGGGCGGGSSCGSSSCSSPSTPAPSSCSSVVPSLPFPSSCSSSPSRREKEKPKDKDKGSWWPWKRRNPSPAPKLGMWIDTVNPLTLDAGNRPGRADLEQLAQTKGVLH